MKNEPEKRLVFGKVLLFFFFFFSYRRNLGAAAHGENVVCVFFIG